ncbi:MarR family winged helix-turn-helix transcriptional regulator [Arthrobacter sp. ISL-95]|uniref:MarR family winged helix-turn-helix transcriptional regulator n=1 Tax=Arthrobacter sp. ISL-95 TaxID=2819116 RepID=UPI001BE64C51|nr:MarR family transcriptional regulator [Arthrobacter sp. ISL-95]MBT2588558.1 MarR family transcriptional regulator [Arthrobacter sp. ISL-95]
MPEIERWPASHLLTTAARLVDRALNESLQPIGLTYAGAVALQILALTGPVTQTALAEAIGVRAQSLGETLARLEAQNCVDLQREGRVQLVSMTGHGTQMLERVVEAEQVVLARLRLDNVLLDELQALVGALTTT